MCPRPPYFYRMPNISLRVSPDVRNCLTVIKSRDSGGGPYYPSGPYSACHPYLIPGNRNSYRIKPGKLFIQPMIYKEDLADILSRRNSKFGSETDVFSLLTPD